MSFPILQFPQNQLAHNLLIWNYQLLQIDFVESVGLLRPQKQQVFEPQIDYFVFEIGVFDPDSAVFDGLHDVVLVNDQRIRELEFIDVAPQIQIQSGWMQQQVDDFLVIE